MNHKIMAFLFGAGFSLSSTAFAATEVSPKVFVRCSLKGTVRTIEVQEAQGYFETFYTKNGETKSIGTGKNFESCVGFMNNVKTNLEKSGWECKEVSGVSVTKESAPQ